MMRLFSKISHTNIKCSTNTWIYKIQHPVVGPLSHLLCWCPPTFSTAWYMCKCVCDALNPIDLQTCYQGQIVHQGKMSLSGPFVEVETNFLHPHRKVRFLIIVMSRSHASCQGLIFITGLSVDIKGNKKINKKMWMLAADKTDTATGGDVAERFGWPCSCCCSFI